MNENCQNYEKETEAEKIADSASGSEILDKPPTAEHLVESYEGPRAGDSSPSLSKDGQEVSVESDLIAESGSTELQLDQLYRLHK